MSATQRPDDDDTVIRAPNVGGAPAPRSADALASTSNALPIGTRLFEFEITGLIGEGGFGIVYRAYDQSLQRDVALKEYMPASLAARKGWNVAPRSDAHAAAFAAGLRSFVNEAHLLAMFDHPSLVKVYRFWEENGTAYIVMPRYEGLTLKATLKRLGHPPDEAWLKDLLRPLLDALELIHHQRCFHRDIAPDNILILTQGRPLLLDFGAARQAIGDFTHALTAILKPGYAPLEQYAEVPSMKQGAWTDIYALASVVYFAITGQTPMPSVGRVVSDTLEPLASVAAGRYSDRFLRAIDKALAVRPEDRPQDVAQLVALMGLTDRRQHPRASVPRTAQAPLHAEHRDGAELPSVFAATATVVNKPGRRMLYATGGAILLALFATGAFYLLPKQEPQIRDIAQPAPAPAPAAAPAAAPAPAPAPAPATAPSVLEPTANAPAANETGSPSSGPPQLSDKSIGTEDQRAGAEPVDASGPRVPAAPMTIAAKANPAPVAKTSLPQSQEISARCRDILERTSLGETLSPEERTILKRECR
jgi:serine/threonine protein kinase